MKKRLLCLLVVLAFVMSFAVGCSPAEETTAELPQKAAEPEVTEEYITIFAVGDNLLHMPVVNSGKQADGSYDFSHIYANLQPRIKDADIAVINQETIFGGDNLGYSGYPMFNSPSDMGKTLVNEGFDVVLHASNHTLDRHASGIEYALDFWKAYPQVTVLGINESPEAKEKVNIKEVKGAKLALLNYTYGTNGMYPPQGKEYLLNYIDEAKIEQDATYAEENADFTIAFMHWGTEYSTKPDASQKALAEKMCAWGVDLVIGAHPHVLEPVEWVESSNGNRMLVYYSLGNFVSRQINAVNLLGGIADVKLKYDGKKVTLEEYQLVPIVTHYNPSCTEFSVYTLDSYTDELASRHGVAAYDGKVSVERWNNIYSTIMNQQ